ncbi:LSM-domain-containing protein [Calocera viscosa TUFC12733]|uniref:Small nuclear ribonucleoprotein G n=1 Tax=Calocera viscosa (strain TUFC12733) TaxID=1330018 RepID=A0A167NSZ3_CALVF|nr:LSM-domain-containing protein [Calocera viscosa TUFC12733]
MSRASQPELKKVRRFRKQDKAKSPDEGFPFQFMDKRLFVQLQGGRKVSGILRGYDIFLNLVIDDAIEETRPAEKKQIGQVVIRGNSVTSMESLEATR